MPIVRIFVHWIHDFDFIAKIFTRCSLRCGNVGGWVGIKDQCWCQRVSSQQQLFETPKVATKAHDVATYSQATYFSGKDARYNHKDSSSCFTPLDKFKNPNLFTHETNLIKDMHKQ
jgi:hypothetical protein